MADLLVEFSVRNIAVSDKNLTSPGGQRFQSDTPPVHVLTPKQQQVGLTKLLLIVTKEKTNLNSLKYSKYIYELKLDSC